MSSVTSHTDFKKKKKSMPRSVQCCIQIYYSNMKRKGLTTSFCTGVKNKSTWHQILVDRKQRGGKIERNDDTHREGENVDKLTI